MTIHRLFQWTMATAVLNGTLGVLAYRSVGTSPNHWAAALHVSLGVSLGILSSAWVLWGFERFAARARPTWLGGARPTEKRR